ncbi:MAG: PAS-domain containing protein [Roseovarius sp.]|uniref:PAS-domain containing protein n=1 Tax=Roseovarius sp. TaxID=1486281 RepID=UPI0040582F84
MTGTDMAVLAATALALAVAALWIAGALLPAPRRAPAAPPDPCVATSTFLLRDGALIDTDAGEDALTLPQDGDCDDWARLARWLAPRFALPGQPPEGTHHYTTQDPEADPATLAIETDGPRTRLTLRDPRAVCPATRHALLAHLAETSRQGAALSRMPMPVWLHDKEGCVTWENAAAAALPPDDRAQLLSATDSARVALDSPPRWFDLACHADAGGTLVFATDVTPLVRTEEARRDFVQTLGRSFADLPTGLAVFDRAHRLAMFNPALADLTGLDPVFLSGRPEIFSFFDILRDRQVMPEPKNYASWRGQIHAMIDAAHDGQYREVWSLVTGRTYRVTGRPHPDGAVAFLVEDISDEISATRHQRAERDVLLAALDRVDDAIAVLSRDAGLVFCNRRFATLARLDPDAREAGMPLDAVIDTCRARLPDDALWQGVAARFDTAGPAQAMTGQLARDTGRALALSLVPLGPGQMMLTLRRAPPEHPRTALSA